MTPILLDTCAAIWISDDDPLTDNAVIALNDARQSKAIVYVSPMSAWEIGMLISKGRYRAALSANAWFDRLVGTDGAGLADLSPGILIASSYLPGRPPDDPTDRILIATARENGFRIMTRDRKILSYANEGHVQAIVC